MQRLKAANPSLKILIYKDLSGMVERDQWGGVSTGVATQDAAAHPEWFLQNTSGQRFTFRYYDWIWAADVGNAGYQQKWADNVLAEMGDKGWDGVFMDDTNPSMEYHYDVARVAKYPTDAAYQAATGSALAAIGARFRSAGKLVIPNFGFWKDYPAVINGWLRHVDGGMNENFVKVGTGPGADTYDRASVWETQLQSIKDAEAQGKLYLGVSHSSDDRRAPPPATATPRCCSPAPATRASRCTATTPTRTGSRSTTTRSATPAGAETKDASGVHRRKFTNGLVLVNPTTASVRVELRRRLHRLRPDRRHRRDPAAHTALVLAKAGGGAPFQSSRAKTARREDGDGEDGAGNGRHAAQRRGPGQRRSRATAHGRGRGRRPAAAGTGRRRSAHRRPPVTAAAPSPTDAHRSRRRASS